MTQKSNATKEVALHDVVNKVTKGSEGVYEAYLRPVCRLRSIVRWVLSLVSMDEYQRYATANFDERYP